MLGVGQRRAFAEALRSQVPHATPLKLAEGHADVRRAVHRFEVDARRADHGSLKAMVMTNDPARHVATVRVSMHTEPARVDVGPAAHLVHRGHDVEIVLTTPIAHDRLREAAPVRRRTARVDQQHEVARGREHLLRRVERIVERAVRAAVDVQDQRIGSRRAEARR